MCAQGQKQRARMCAQDRAPARSLVGVLTGEGGGIRGSVNSVCGRCHGGEHRHDWTGDSTTKTSRRPAVSAAVAAVVTAIVGGKVVAAGVLCSAAGVDAAAVVAAASAAAALPSLVRAEPRGLGLTLRFIRSHFLSVVNVFACMCVRVCVFACV